MELKAQFSLTRSTKFPWKSCNGGKDSLIISSAGFKNQACKVLVTDKILGWFRQNVDFEVVCSKGTYIRSLCADFAMSINRYRLIPELSMQTMFLERLLVSVLPLSWDDHLLLPVMSSVVGLLLNSVFWMAMRLWFKKKLWLEGNASLSFLMYDSGVHII